MPAQAEAVLKGAAGLCARLGAVGTQSPPAGEQHQTGKYEVDDENHQYWNEKARDDSKRQTRISQRFEDPAGGKWQHKRADGDHHKDCLLPYHKARQTPTKITP
jgi:hypothetical protein